MLIALSAIHQPSVNEIGLVSMCCFSGRWRYLSLVLSFRSVYVLRHDWGNFDGETCFENLHRGADDYYPDTTVLRLM
uniref:Uncharacterized protein n=2 Tax=Salmonella sp. TaxID=599 RepID=A0A482EVI1_SALSP|nr:hypothetical protein NNIBIDOC_00092 [Salmonella sp.]